MTILMPFGSCALLVIQGSCSTIATREEKMVNSKLLVNQWRKEPSSRDQLGHHLAFTKSDDDPGCCGEL
jgi:hypothetical protein